MLLSKKPLLLKVTLALTVSVSPFFGGFGETETLPIFSLSVSLPANTQNVTWLQGIRFHSHRLYYDLGKYNRSTIEKLVSMVLISNGRAKTGCS